MIEPGKVCFKCSVHKPLDEFYHHPAMGDGRLGKCKECTKKDVHDNYLSKTDQYKAYERERSDRPERKQQVAKYQKQRRIKNPEKERVRAATSKLIQTGKLKRLPCEHCGSEPAEAHHETYDDPYKVKWLCFVCHRKTHGQLKYLESSVN